MLQREVAADVDDLTVSEAANKQASSNGSQMTLFSSFARMRI